METNGFSWFDAPRADKPSKQGPVRARAERLKNGLTLIVAQDREAQEELDDLREVIARDFGLAAIVTLLLAIIGGMVMSAGMLRRVDTINRTAREIVPNVNRLARITPGGEVTEFDVPTRASGLGDVAVDAAGVVWFVEQRTNKIGRFAEGRFTEFAVPGHLPGLTAIAVAPINFARS